ncbi:unnamed protein product [Mytilus edulis]|uniref:DUF5641 domain-containing protein n=1 Tax=Mytilus edulis TaxID=6550 RepID=A0A8S3QA40_MYTED|nr:unnamed protein product [Mytilus edulis]
MNVPSASHMGGVWERQIRSVRNVLASLMHQSGTQLDDESLRTFMCEAAAIVNSRPLTLDNLNDPLSEEPLTPNHILTMKSKIILPPPGQFQRSDIYSRKRWRRVQFLANEFWNRWRKEYLSNLQSRKKWTAPRRNLQVGDIVMIKDEQAARNQWHLGKINTAHVDEDGLVRKVRVTISADDLGKKNNMESFWNALALALSKKSEKNYGNYDCTVWVGALEHGVYGKKVMNWPDGTRTLERAHRLSYMLDKRILKENLPRFSPNGDPLDISHLCHNPKCIKPEHLILESHSINIERIFCRRTKQCTNNHLPCCLI